MSKLKITLAAARVNAGFSQSDVCKLLHKSPITICRWENGKTRIDEANLLMLCNL